MSFIFSSPLFVGIDCSSSFLARIAILKEKKEGGWEVLELREHPLAELNSLQLPPQAQIISSLASRDVLIRHLEIPLKKKKDLEAALPFQIEPLLPYPLESSFLTYQINEQNSLGTSLTLYSCRKENLSHHLQQTNSLSVLPEKVTCHPLALSTLCSLLPSSTSPHLLAFRGEKEGCALLVQEGKLLAARSFEPHPQEMAKALFSLQALPKGKAVESIYLLSTDKQLGHRLQEIIDKPLLPFPASSLELTEEKWNSHALAIGIALAGAKEGLPFFQAAPLQLAKLPKYYRKSFLTYLLASAVVSLSVFGLSAFSLNKQEKKLQASYLSLAQTLGEKEISPLGHENREEEITRLMTKIENAPETFPLLPLVPHVSDVLAWISNLSQTLSTAEGKPLFKIEHFDYALVKRPLFLQRQERYQVKIQVEISSQQPQQAKAFHDALLAPNAFVDPRHDVTWTPNKGHYTLSFYLKDKTRYQ